MNKDKRPKISVYIAVSIDGYIARENGGLDWLEKYNLPNEDYGYNKFMTSVDALCLGRNSYEKVLSFGNWPFNEKRVIVLSRSLSSVTDKAELYNGDIIYLTQKLHAEGIKHIYVDGGITISHFINAGLVDQLTISIIPIILGSGIPLFNKIQHETTYHLTVSNAYSNGLVQLRYERQKIDSSIPNMSVH